MPTTDRVFRRKVQDRFPEIASQVIEEPVLHDVSEIERLFDIFSLLVCLPDNPKSSEVVDFRTLFIAVTLRLYDPDYMNGYRRKVRNGLRDKIASLFEVENAYVSYLFSLVTHRVQIYKDVAENVNSIYKAIVKNFVQEKVL